MSTADTVLTLCRQTLSDGCGAKIQSGANWLAMVKEASKGKKLTRTEMAVAGVTAEEFDSMDADK